MWGRVCGWDGANLGKIFRAALFNMLAYACFKVGFSVLRCFRRFYAVSGTFPSNFAFLSRFTSIWGPIWADRRYFEETRECRWREREFLAIFA